MKSKDRHTHNASSIVQTLATALAVVVLCSVSSPAQADDKPDVAAALEQGRALFKEGKRKKAAEVWRQAFSHASGEVEVKLAINLGIAYFKLGEDAEAFYFLSYFNTRRGNSYPKRAAKAASALHKLSGKLAKTHSRITLTSEPGDARVYLDDKSGNRSYKTPAILFLPPGEHQLRIIRQGFKDHTEKVTAKAGATRVLTVALETLEPEKPVEIAKPVAPEDPAQPSTRFGPWPWIALGAGAALAGGGGVLLYTTSNDWDDTVAEAQRKVDEEGWQLDAAADWKDDYFRDTVQPKNRLSIGLFVAGGAALAAGAAMILLDDSPAATVFIPALSAEGDATFLFSSSF